MSKATEEIYRIIGKVRIEICAKCKDLWPNKDCSREDCKTMQQIDAVEAYTNQTLAALTKQPDLENEIEKWKKFWKKHHPYEDAKPSKKGIEVHDAEFGKWYWFPKLKQWAQREEGFDSSDGRPLFFGPNGFAKRVSYGCIVYPIKGDPK